MNYLVIYPGRFHPFHQGHKASYDYLVKKYGPNSVYIVTSDVQAPITSPFSFSDKVQMMTKLGVPSSHVVKVRNPYQAKEITDNLTNDQKQETVMIFAVSEKDMLEGSARFQFGAKKNGEPSYLQPMPENPKQMKPMNKHAYVAVTPTVNFRVQGKDADSASQIRQLYQKSDDINRDKIITDLYGAPDADLRSTFDTKLGITEKIQEYIQEIRDKKITKGLQLLEQVLLLERESDPGPEPEDLIEDYIDEKWSQKYKSSINCSNPKGFSQRAHCAGRKKK
jgi:hypothetical protein